MRFLWILKVIFWYFQLHIFWGFFSICKCKKKNDFHFFRLIYFLGLFYFFQIDLGYYCTQKDIKGAKKTFFWLKGKKSLCRSFPQELEFGPRNGPYRLVDLIEHLCNTALMWTITGLSVLGCSIIQDTL